jgi:chaperonin GroES
MSERISPLGDKVLIRRSDFEEKTPGGIIIPDSAKEKTQQGKVIAVGPGKTLNDGKVLPLAVKAGDVVFFGKYAGTEVGSEFIIVREDEILGVVR